MPYYFDPLLEEDRKRREALQDPNTPTLVSGSGPVVGGATPTTKPGSGRWTNLQAFMDKNRDQAGQMGTALADDLRSEGDRVREESQKAEGQFRTDLESDSKPLQYRGVVEEAFKDPTKVASDPEKFQQFTSVRDLKYQPRSFGTYGDALNQQADKADTKSKLSESEEGRYTLLSEKYARPTYTRGEKDLDNLLVQNDPNSRTKLAGARNSINDAKAALEPQKRTLEKMAADRAKELADFTMQALGIKSNAEAARAKANNTLTQKSAEQNAQYEKLFEELAKAGQGGLLSRKRAQELGVESRNGYDGDSLYLYGANPVDYLSRPALDLDSVTSDDEQAQMNALEKLAGLTQTTFDPSRPQQTNLAPLDIDRLNVARNTKMAAFDAEAAPVMKQILLGPDTQVMTKIAEANAIRQRYGLPNLDPTAIWAERKQGQTIYGVPGQLKPGYGQPQPVAPPSWSPTDISDSQWEDLVNAYKKR